MFYFLRNIHLIWMEICIKVQADLLTNNLMQKLLSQINLVYIQIGRNNYSTFNV